MSRKQYKKIVGGFVCSSLLLSTVVSHGQLLRAETTEESHLSSATVGQANPERKEAILQEIEASSASKGLKIQYKNLIAQENSLDKIETLYKEFQEKVTQEQGRQTLTQLKEAAQKAVRTLPYLSLAHGDDYIAQLENVSSVEEIEQILAAAQKTAIEDKVLHGLREKTKEKIRALEHLSGDQKASYEEEIDREKTSETMDALYKRASREDQLVLAQNSLVNIQKLVTQVDALPDLPNGPDYDYEKKLWAENRKVIEDTASFLKNKGSLATEEQLSYVTDNLTNPLYCYAQIELLTRQVTLYRIKYPHQSEIEARFKAEFVQTENESYASLGIKDLRLYVSSLQKEVEKLKELVAKLDALDFSTLENAVQQSKKVNLTNKTQASVTILKEAKEKAERLLSKKGREVLRQQDIAQTAQELTKAIADLKDAKPQTPKVTPQPSPKPHTPKAAPQPKANDKKPTVQPVYRLYHSGLQVHLYTIDVNEYKVLAGRGWQQEGVAWQTSGTGQPVYRLYHSGLKVHLYTKDANEYKVLAARGWNQEGVAYYSEGTIKVYRLYHPGLKKHLYTKDTNEYRVLATRGWIQEGIAWYAR